MVGGLVGWWAGALTKIEGESMSEKIDYPSGARCVVCGVWRVVWYGVVWRGVVWQCVVWNW